MKLERSGNVALRGRVVDGDAVPKLYATFDRGVALPFGPLVHLAAKRRRLTRRGPRDEPFANFFFGGFGNNYVDHRDEKRYREYYSFPGAELNEIGGRNFVQVHVEWNLPPWRFSQRRHARVLCHLGAAGRVRQRAGDKHGCAVRASCRDQRRRTARPALLVLSALDLTLSVGGAVVVERGQAPR